MEGSSQQNGGGPSGKDSPHRANNPGGRLRPPTVLEALPYSPFGSIAPFSPDVVTPPLAFPKTPSSVFSNSEGVIAAKRMLDELSAGALNAEKASERCRQTLQDVQKLIEPAGLMTFSFKSSMPVHLPRGTPQTHHPSKSRLSAFAKMVLDQSTVPYSYLEPWQHQTSNERNGHPPAQKLETTPVKPSINHSTGVNERTKFPPIVRKVHVVAPNVLTPAERAEYQYVPEPDAVPILNGLSPRKHKEPASMNSLRTMNLDQKQKTDVAVQNLQNLLLEIFQAEDQLEPDTSEKATRETALFAERDTENGSIRILRSDIQRKLESCIQKVAKAGRLNSIEVEDLSRAQKICENAVVAVDSLDLRVGDDWNDSDTEEWLMKLATAENSITAARTLMRIMAGAAQQKELQSEEFLSELLRVLKTVIEGCLIPIIEEPMLLREKIRGEKDGPPLNPKFVVASSHRGVLQSLLAAGTKSIQVLGELLVKTDFEGSAISSVEYLCKTLVFAENANTEKESVVGLQNFENMRRAAMDVLAKIFTKYTDQRDFIISEILVSLEKLPATKQSARQYRLVDSKPIQLVSALLMRLVQVSATRSSDTLNLRRPARGKNDYEDVSDDEDIADEASSDEEVNTKASPRKSSADLRSIVKPLFDTANMHAAYIIKILVQRALSSSKSSDEPYRRLLDIFTEDFLNVLGSSDWPAAEVLLRNLVLNMIRMIENPKNPAPSRTLALELLGAMGSGILELQMTARSHARSTESVPGSKIAERLQAVVRQLETDEVDTSILIALDGPYRLVVEFLEARAETDPQLQAARGYHLTEWAFLVCGGREGSTGTDGSDAVRAPKHLQDALKQMIFDTRWFEPHCTTPPITASENRLAAMTLTLSSNFCRAFNRIFSILLSSMGSEQPTIKNRSLKSVTALLERDPTILDRSSYVLNHIFRCTTDASPMVRDSALSLIATCINLRPTLDSAVFERVIARTGDANAGVRKRALKLLKDVYLRSDDKLERSAIAHALVSRVDDVEEGVKEIARTTIEEVWFQPLYNLKRDEDRAVQAKLAYSSQVAILVETLERGAGVVKVLGVLLKQLLTTSKAAAANFRVCKTMVADLFDGMIDNTEIQGAPPQDAILRSLTVFAKAGPKLFTAAQLERLEPYTQNLSSADDVEVYRSVIAILHHVIPHQSTMKPEFLQTMRQTLLRSVTKLSLSQLKEVVPCLWTIDQIMANTDHFVSFMTSALSNIYKRRGDDLATDQQASAKAAKLIMIVGEFGKVCDFRDDLAEFTGRGFQWFKGDSVAGLIVEVLCGFMSPAQPLGLRLASLGAVCSVCQAWPKQFLRSDVTNAFETVFMDHVSELEEILIAGLEGFFCAQEGPIEDSDMPELGNGIASGTERLGRTYVASDQDGASTSIAQRFLPSILRLALASCDESAFIAANLVISINRQGLVHPKESGTALVALETCPNTAIAKMAFVEHKAQHTKHESLYEKEYMRAVQQAFEYQERVTGNIAGHTGQPPLSKLYLLWEVLKTGRAQVRKKFLGNMAQKVDFDLSKISPKHARFAQFSVENLAFFEYEKLEDVQQLLNSLEKAFAGTGTVVAQAIESEVLKLQVDTLANADTIVVDSSDPVVDGPSLVSIDPYRLRQLALGAQTLCFVWETRSFIRRVWNMQKYMTKSKQPAKEANRALNRIPNARALSEAFLKRTNEIASAIDSAVGQRAICGSLVELMAVDNEVKVVSDEDADADDANGYDTPSEGSGRKSPSFPPSGSGHGRKRKQVSTNNTPRKKGRSKGNKNKSGSFVQMEDDDEDGGWD